MSCFVMRGPRDVMFCHGPPPAVPATQPPLRAGAPGMSSVFVIASPPDPPAAAEPFFARNARAPGRARYAAARFARLIAPARASRPQGTPLPSVSQGRFFAPAPTRGEAASGCPSRFRSAFILSRRAEMQARARNFLACGREAAGEGERPMTGSPPPADAPPPPRCYGKRRRRPCFTAARRYGPGGTTVRRRVAPFRDRGPVRPGRQGGASSRIEPERQRILRSLPAFHGRAARCARRRGIHVRREHGAALPGAPRPRPRNPPRRPPAEAGDGLEIAAEAVADYSKSSLWVPVRTKTTMPSGPAASSSR